MKLVRVDAAVVVRVEDLEVLSAVAGKELTEDLNVLLVIGGLAEGQHVIAVAQLRLRPLLLPHHRGSPHPRHVLMERRGRPEPAGRPRRSQS